MKRHVPPDKECNICHLKFRFIERHMRIVHTFERPFQCAVCGANFKGRNNLNGHMKTHEQPTECPICNKFLPNMKRHLQWHKKPKPDPIQCPQCERMYSNKQAVQEHISRVHERRPLGKSYSCEVCDLRFIRNRDLRRHSFIHYSGKIFVCDFPGCNDMFKKRFKLQAHVMVHSSEREANFECESCGKKYLRRTALFKHEKLAHGSVSKPKLMINIVKTMVN